MRVRYAVLFFVGFVLLPFFASAQNNVNQLIWGDVVTGEETGETISDDRITIVEGGTYSVQLNVEKNAKIKYASEKSYMPRGTLYYIPDATNTGTSAREFVKSFYTMSYLVWEKSGAYELDIYGEPPPFLMMRDKPPFWKLALRLLVGPRAYADSHGDVFLGTIRFTITDKDAVQVCATNCNSNVLFLPGIEGSRLYEGTGCGENEEKKLWEPVESFLGAIRGVGDAKVKRLFLDSYGKSVCSDVYAKTSDIIDSAGGGNIYKLFIDEMDSLKSGDEINDWKAVAYDWRLSLTDLLNKGAERNGKIFYTEATSTPYIEQTLRALAESSKTGKVTIVAHSNGGLVAKALLNKLGGEEAAKLVNKIIMVGAPQSGAPETLGTILVGYDAGIYADFFKFKNVIKVVSNAVGQKLALNAPMAYHLLPSQNYFDSVADDTAHPVGSFAGGAYEREISSYGLTIDDRTEMDDFMRSFSDSTNSSLIDYANDQHYTLDIWTPPDGIEVNQIAGWGASTVVGIDFYTLPPINALTAINQLGTYRPIFTEDGDGIVPIPSALMMASSTNVKRYWLDLHAYNIETNSNKKHKNLFEIPQLEDFIKNIITNGTSILPSYIAVSQPPPTGDKRLTFFLHSPLTLELKDSAGNITGIAKDGTISGEISGAEYGEFGDVKYIIADGGASYELILHGQDTGTFSLDIQESSGGIITASSTIANVPVTSRTIVSLTLSGGIETVSALTVDVDGDGANIITITPKVGETTNYEPPPPPAPEPEPAIISVNRGGGRRIPVSVITADLISPTQTSTTTATTANIQATTTLSVVASMPETAVSAKTVKTKNPVEVPKKEKENISVPQTASAYSASQQPLIARASRAVYNGLYALWIALKRFF
jgi:pimeloyl-ACP methyl ester carboxylesterase